MCFIDIILCFILSPKNTNNQILGIFLGETTFHQTSFYSYSSFKYNLKQQLSKDKTMQVY